MMVLQPQAVWLNITMTGIDADAELGRVRASLPAARNRGDVFSVEIFLTDCVRTDDVLRADNRTKLTALRRKVEVARKLAAHYESDLRKPSDDAVADPQYALLLCACYLALADKAGDIESLNAALKMMDGILLAPVLPADSGLDRWAERILASASFRDA